MRESEREGGQGREKEELSLHSESLATTGLVGPPLANMSNRKDGSSGQQKKQVLCSSVCGMLAAKAVKKCVSVSTPSLLTGD